MSNYFDVVFSCDLRDDTPEEVIDVIRYLTDKSYELKEKPNISHEYFGDLWEIWQSNHFLAPDPEYEIISNFRKLPWLGATADKPEVNRYCLQYSGRYIHDDFWVEHHFAFIFWVAPYVLEDFMGYVKYTEGGKPELIVIETGKPRGDWFLPSGYS